MENGSIVRIEGTGIVGIVRATFLNAVTGEELVEVQPVGRNLHRFVLRSEVGKVGDAQLSVAIAAAIEIAIDEIRKTVDGTASEDAIRMLEECELAKVKLLRSVDRTAARNAQ